MLELFKISDCGTGVHYKMLKFMEICIPPVYTAVLLRICRTFTLIALFVSD